MCSCAWRLRLGAEETGLALLVVEEVKEDKNLANTFESLLVYDLRRYIIRETPNYNPRRSSHSYFSKSDSKCKIDRNCNGVLLDLRNDIFGIGGWRYHERTIPTDPTSSRSNHDSFFTSNLQLGIRYLRSNKVK